MPSAESTKGAASPASARNSWQPFTEVSGGHQVKSRLRKMVSFAQMNLASAVYVGRMDMIFCMNVLIYFSEERGVL